MENSDEKTPIDFYNTIKRNPDMNSEMDKNTAEDNIYHSSMGGTRPPPSPPCRRGTSVHTIGHQIPKKVEKNSKYLRIAGHPPPPTPGGGVWGVLSKEILRKFPKFWSKIYIFSRLRFGFTRNMFLVFSESLIFFTIKDSFSHSKVINFFVLWLMMIDLLQWNNIVIHSFRMVC